MIIIIPCNVYLFFFSSIVLSLINLYLFHVYRYPYKHFVTSGGNPQSLILRVLDISVVGVA